MPRTPRKTKKAKAAAQPDGKLSLPGDMPVAPALEIIPAPVRAVPEYSSKFTPGTQAEQIYSNPGKASKIAIIERRQVALQLRKQGGTYVEVAASMRTLLGEQLIASYDGTQAYRDVIVEVTRLMQENREQAAAVLQIELLRLDELMAAIWDEAIDHKNLFAVDRVLAIMDRRARYLGLIPTKKEPAYDEEERVSEDPGELDPARVARLAEILDAARKRRSERDSAKAQQQKAG